MAARCLALGLVAVLLGAAAAHAAGSPPFAGATLTHPGVPPDFALRDQDGRTVRLSAQHGKVVLVTFLYTHCPDVCPLTAVNINRALLSIGPARAGVSALAVSVDPRGDTRAAVRAFVRSHRLGAQFHYLTGSADALRRVWQAYHVKAVRDGQGAGVDHTLYTLAVDRKGVARVLFDATARSSAIAHDLRLLLAT